MQPHRGKEAPSPQAIEGERRRDRVGNRKAAEPAIRGHPPVIAVRIVRLDKGAIVAFAQLVARHFLRAVARFVSRGMAGGIVAGAAIVRFVRYDLVRYHAMSSLRMRMMQATPTYYVGEYGCHGTNVKEAVHC